MLKTITFLLSGLIVTFAAINVANAAPTATIINQTNCVCEGFGPDYTNCKLEGRDQGVPIQAQNSDFSPFGPVIGFGGFGSAPIFKSGDFDTIMVNVMEPNGFNSVASYGGAQLYATYYVIANTHGPAIKLYAISRKPQCH